MEYKIKDIKINYEIIGKGKPIIMVHGYSVDHRVMKGCMEPIFNDKSGYKRIYIDLPGMGKSSSANWITNADKMLDILVDFIEEVIPNENFLLAGESYGGYLSRGIAYKMSNKIDGILLICPVIIADSKKRNVNKHTVLSKLSSEDAKDFKSDLVIQSEKICEKYKNEVLSGIEISDNEFLRNFKENGYQFSFNVDKVSKKFNKPTLILLGRQDSCVGYKDAWNILEDFPRATFAILDRAGHNLQIEQEKLFDSLVTEWILRVEEYINNK